MVGESGKGPGFEMRDKPDAMPNEIDFATLVYSFATSAMFSLGKVPNPESGQSVAVNLPMAKQNIDILGVLQEKTRGNLSPDEDKMLEHFVTELRLLYVETSKKQK